MQWTDQHDIEFAALFHERANDALDNMIAACERLHYENMMLQRDNRELRAERGGLQFAFGIAFLCAVVAIATRLWR